MAPAQQLVDHTRHRGVKAAMRRHGGERRIGAPVDVVAETETGVIADTNAALDCECGRTRAGDADDVRAPALDPEVEERTDFLVDADAGKRAARLVLLVAVELVGETLDHFRAPADAHDLLDRQHAAVGAVRTAVTGLAV